MTEPIRVERRIAQVGDRDGVEYRGTIKINAVTLGFKVVFVKPISYWLDETKKSGKPVPESEWRNICQVRIFHAEQEVPLEGELEWRFFFKFIAPLAAEYYQNPFVQNCNESPTMRASWRGEQVLDGVVSYGPVEQSYKDEYDFSPEVRTMLNAKFCCET